MPSAAPFVIMRCNSIIEVGKDGSDNLEAIAIPFAFTLSQFAAALPDPSGPDVRTWLWLAGMAQPYTIACEFNKFMDYVKKAAHESNESNLQLVTVTPHRLS